MGSLSSLHSLSLLSDRDRARGLNMPGSNQPPFLEGLGLSVKSTAPYLKKKKEGGRDTVFPLHTAHTHNGRTRTASPVSNVRLAAFAWRVVDWTVDHRRATATLCRISQFPTHQTPPSPQKGIDCSLPAGWPPRRGARVPSPIPLAPLAASLLCFVSCAPSIKDGGGGSQGGERASIFL